MHSILHEARGPRPTASPLIHNGFRRDVSTLSQPFAYRFHCSAADEPAAIAQAARLHRPYRGMSLRLTFFSVLRI